MVADGWTCRLLELSKTKELISIGNEGLFRDENIEANSSENLKLEVDKQRNANLDHSLIGLVILDETCLLIELNCKDETGGKEPKIRCIKRH